MSITIDKATNQTPYNLVYRELGRRANTTRWAKRKVAGTRDAVAWMNANRDKAFLPASVETNSWRPEVVAILGDLD